MASGAPQGSRAWLHVAASCAAGAAIVGVAQYAVVALVFGGVVQAATMLAIAFGVFAAVGSVFVGTTRGWLQGFTALIWAPLVVWSFVRSPGDDDLGGTEPLTFAVGAGVAGLAALLMHEGWPRVAGAVLGVAATVGTATTLLHRDQVEDRAAAIAAYGTPVRPWVLGLDGYRQHGDPVVVTPDVLRTSFYRPEQSADRDLALTVTTDSSTTSVCGDVLRADLGAQVEQRETSCRQVGSTWRRTSEGGHEVAVVRSGRVVRVAASGRVPVSELTAALRSVRPISDRYYRHALFGEDGEHIPELDGAR